MLARVRDPRDRRRTLVWLTDRAREWLEEEQEPLDRERTRAVFDAMDATVRGQFVEAFEQFIAVAERMRDRDGARNSVEITPHRIKQEQKEGK
jgi:DNA-binding MarR family transcriptional regulator